MPDFAITITPRFYETDALGHINNASIAAWFEVARMHFLDTVVERGPESAKDWVLASLKIDFINETFFGTDVIATIVGAGVGNSSLTVECEMSQDEKPTVKGTAVLVHLDPQSKTPVRIPDELRQAVEDL